MLGELIGEGMGRITGRRVLANPGGGPTTETSFEASGKVLGVAMQEVGTYTSEVRTNGTLFGSGQGIVMGQAGELATWVGSGVGVIRQDGGVSYRGAIFFQSATAGLARLMSVAVVFEFEVDAQGATKAKLWEWK